MSSLPESHITPTQWASIAAACTASYPNEACGLFVGKSWDAAELVPMENIQDAYHSRDPVRYPRQSRTAYLMHPLRLMEHVERGGGLLAIWHSHCEVGAYFSAEDVKVALGGEDAPIWPGTAYLVMSCRNRQVDGAKWFEWDPIAKAFPGRDVVLPAL
jgi:proteasome lid subunit RPN8/RPN11